MNTREQESEEVREWPLEMKVINFLGLNSFLFDQMVFRRKRGRYKISKMNGKNIIINSCGELYEPPSNYKYKVEVFQRDGYSVPALRLTPTNHRPETTIIYSHGNSADLYNSLMFMERMVNIIPVEYVVFDYSGYGASQIDEVTEESICHDLEIVMSWITQDVRCSNIILWGFSLGTYPVTHCAIKYPILGLILQSPIASISCLFDKKLHSKVKFQKDYLSTLNIIDQVKSYLLIIHSIDDEIIPFQHSKMLYQKHLRARGPTKLQFLEITKLKHNDSHQYLCSCHQNPLQDQFLLFYHEMCKGKEVLKHSQVSNSSTKTSKITLVSHHCELRNSRKQNAQELRELYGELEARNITEEAEEQYQIVYQDGKKKKISKGNNVKLLPTCFCL